jgi:hypothetical protein
LCESVIVSVYVAVVVLCVCVFLGLLRRRLACSGGFFCFFYLVLTQLGCRVQNEARRKHIEKLAEQARPSAAKNFVSFHGPPLRRGVGGAVLLQACDRCCNRYRAQQPPSNTAAQHGQRGLMADLPEQCLEHFKALDKLLLNWAATHCPPACVSQLKHHVLQCLALLDTHPHQPRPVAVRFMESARMVYLCAQCDHDVHFGTEEHVQSTLFHDREFFSGGQWQHINRNTAVLVDSNTPNSRGVTSTLMTTLFVTPDRPCKCPTSRWQRSGGSVGCDLVIVHDGIRVFKAAEYTCATCNDVVNQHTPSHCNQGFFPLAFAVSAGGPVKWISYSTLHVLQSLVCVPGFVFGWFVLPHMLNVSVCTLPVRVIRASSHWCMTTHGFSEACGKF